MDLKSGWKSSEYWIALVGIGMTLLVAVAVVPASDSDTLSQAATNCVKGAFMFITNAMVIVTYIKGRISLKHAHLAAKTPPPLGTVDVPTTGFKG